MGKSFREYVTAMGHLGWVVLLDILSGAIGLYLDISGTWGFPTWLWLLLLGVGLVIVPFIVFHRVRMGRDELQAQLETIKNARPNIELDVQVAPERLRDVTTGVVIGTPVFAKLLVTNNPTSTLSRVDAPNVASRIEILGENGSLFPTMVGRWANTRHQYQGALPNQVAQMTLHPNGFPEPLLIALKYTDEELAYGLNVDNERMSGWRDQNKPIPFGIWRVKVHLQGINVDKPTCWTLTNKGKGTDFELKR